MPDTTEEFEVFLARLIEHLKRELADDQDETRSIRRALLGLIIATSDVERRAARRLATFLLQEFPPLAEKFDDDIHMLLDEFDVRRHCGGMTLSCCSRRR